MGKIAFVFAGQGAQSAGMGKELYEHFDSVKRIFDMAGEEIKRLSFEGSVEELSITINAQPCLFSLDLACASALNENGIYADGAAGFSLGEIPAIAHCGIMSEKQALDFVCFRAQAMQECAKQHKGGMFAVLGLTVDQVESICLNLEKAYPVNYNCEKQTVVACSVKDFENLQKSVASCGGKAVKLAVNGAFHSPFMNEASDEIMKYLKNQKLNEMNVPIYSNLTAKIYDDPKRLLSLQVNSPVLWQKTIENMITDGFDVFIEAGPGKTLSGLIKRISSDVKVLNVCDLASLDKVITEVKNGGTNA